MRIVQVSVGSVRMPPKEGSAPLQVIFNTSKHLAKIGHHVVILDRQYAKGDPTAEQIESVEIARLKARQVPVAETPAFMRFFLAEVNAVLFALMVSRYLRRNGSAVDAIHLHLTSTGLIACLLNRGLRKKMFYTCHLGYWALAESRLNIRTKFYLLLDSYLMRRVRKVIALNEMAKASFTSLGKVKAENVVVLPNGVDTDFFHPGVRAEGMVKEKYVVGSKTVVLFVGRLTKDKGVGHLIRAANTIVNRFGYKDTLFLIVGPQSHAAVEEPLDMAEVATYLRENQLGGNVVFTGALPVEEVRVLYAICDMFVLPSLAEGDPLVTVEAMASGRPVIGTTVGGIAHQVRDGWNGFLVEPANERQLAEKIRYLIDNPEERKRMGVNSREYAEAEFDWRKIAERLVAVYQSP